MASDRKRAEELKLAEEDYIKAVKYTKKTLTRWKPDWDQAGRYYRDAVKHFKIAGNDDRTIAVARESALAHEELGQFFQCATDLELAATLLQKSSNQNERDQAYDLFKESAINYRKNNNSEKAAGLLLKAAEAAEGTSEDRAIEALRDACAVFEDDQRGQFHDSTFKKAITSCVRYGAIDEAVEFLRRQNRLIKDQSLMSTFRNDFDKNILNIIVLLCHISKYNEAQDELNKALDTDNRFGNTEQCQAAEELLQVLGDGDSEKLAETVKKSPFKYILTPVAVIAKKLKIDNNMPSKPKRAAPRSDFAPSSSKAPSASSTSPAAPTPAEPEIEEKDDDDFT